jgi:transposase-like protein
MRRVLKNERKINGRRGVMEEALLMDVDKESKILMIQALIPLGLSAVKETLLQECKEMAGERYGRGGVVKRWGYNRGSVCLLDQKVKIDVPRLRNVEERREVPLPSYARFQEVGTLEEAAFARTLHGMAQRDYAKAARCVPESFGISKSSVSRRFIRASEKKLAEFMERPLNGHDFVVVFLDGKRFGEHGIIQALGVTMTGEKVLLGFVESASENFEAVRDFLQGLRLRGLQAEREILFVLDGAKGLRKAVLSVFGDKAWIQRCQWHKRENVVSYLGKQDQIPWRRKLQAAYELPSYTEAKTRLMALGKELSRLNLSAAKSLEEGLEETLTLHRLGLFRELGTSLKTTNAIENVQRQIGKHTDRVSRWKNSNQRWRWIASALLAIEPNLRKIKGHRHLLALRNAMKPENNHFQNAA